MANEGGDYATVLGTLCLASGQHAWNVYINHVEDSNLFIGKQAEHSWAQLTTWEASWQGRPSSMLSFCPCGSDACSQDDALAGHISLFDLICSCDMPAGVAVGGHDLNADPQEMKHRTYYLSNGTIRVAGKLMTRYAGSLSALPAPCSKPIRQSLHAVTCCFPLVFVGALSHMPRAT
jgi:hypothetical protein